MNVDKILSAFNSEGVRYLLLGGMNFMLRHEPILTYDVDVWIEDVEANRQRCEKALANIDAEWGATDEDWEPVGKKQPGWLGSQSVYCLYSAAGAVDIFLRVRGLDDWDACWTQSIEETTSSGVAFRGLSDEDMLECQLALDEPNRKRQRIDTLNAIIEKKKDG